MTCLQFLSFVPAMQHWVSDYNVHFNRVLLTATYALSPCPALLGHCCHNDAVPAFADYKPRRLQSGQCMVIQKGTRLLRR